MSERFDQLYRAAVRWRPVSPSLHAHLHQIHARIVDASPDLPALRAALEDLLAFLASDAGRTDANCCAVDAFFSMSDRWERRWEHLPAPYRAVLDDLGGALHDTVYAPRIAATFASLPEQLLDRVRRLD